MPRKSKRSKTKNRTRKRFKKENKFSLKKVKRLIELMFVLIFLVLLAMYYFVLPSVLLSNGEIKNILIISDNLDGQSNYISLAHVSSKLDDNLIVFIDGNKTVEASEDYGNYKLNTIYSLLKIDNQSDQKIKSVFSSIINIPIDEIVVTSNLQNNNLTNKELKNFFIENFLDGFKGSVKNKINLLKLILLSDKMETFEFDEIESIKKINYKLSTLEEEVSQNCSVSVVNTTSRNGLAHEVSEMIENTGAQVMQVEGSDSLLEKTTIYYPLDKEPCKQLIDRISGIFPTKVVLNSSDDIDSIQQFRSSVIVMIGDDY